MHILLRARIHAIAGWLLRSKLTAPRLGLCSRRLGVGMRLRHELRLPRLLVLFHRVTQHLLRPLGVSVALVEHAAGGGHVEGEVHEVEERLDAIEEGEGLVAAIEQLVDPGLALRSKQAGGLVRFCAHE